MKWTEERDRPQFKIASRIHPSSASTSSLVILSPSLLRRQTTALAWAAYSWVISQRTSASVRVAPKLWP